MCIQSRALIWYTPSSNPALLRATDAGNLCQAILFEFFEAPAILKNALGRAPDRNRCLYHPNTKKLLAPLRRSHFNTATHSRLGENTPAPNSKHLDVQRCWLLTSRECDVGFDVCQTGEGSGCPGTGIGRCLRATSGGTVQRGSGPLRPPQDQAQCQEIPCSSSQV